MNHLFPIFLKLNNDDLHLLIVGGGYVGLEKIEAVLGNSPEAKITLIAPEIRAEIRQIAAQNPHVILLQRTFEDFDLVDHRVSDEFSQDQMREIFHYHERVNARTARRMAALGIDPREPGPKL